MISFKLKQEIKADLHRIYPGRFSYKKLFSAVLRTKGFKYMLMLRLKSHPNPLISLPTGFIKRILGYRYGFQIPSNIPIGKGFFIGHFGTIVVSIYASFGNNCNIAHNCTVGASGANNQKKAPQIKDRVWIGAGAVLVGDIVVGPNVVIAPNAFVNFDVPPHSLVIGNPGKIISKQNPTKKYINNAWMG
jgi:serine O-acetyltransferase